MTVSSASNVSRETSIRLEAFAALVRKWNPKINLVSKHSLDDLWERHITDSIQLFGHATNWSKWVDIGSGGGFPGIIVAILAADRPHETSITLIESDQRKCAFLRTAIRELDIEGTVLSKRIEDVPSMHADVLSARALADLDTLLGFAEGHMAPSGTALFPKGRSWQKEHADAQKRWSYSCQAITSQTDPDAAILKIKDIQRV